MAEGDDRSKVGGGRKERPISTTSSQLSISDRMTDGDEEDNSSFRSNLLAQASSSCSSSLNLQRQSKDLSSFILARTTTISTIAMESNTSSPPGIASPTRLVIALLQTPHRGLELKVIELSPGLLKLPDTLPHAVDYLKNHNQVIKNLQSKQSPVEELLRQADNLIATQKPRAEVYAAMADSLGQTWKDLNGILEERKTVIQLAFNAHKNISDCLEKMERVHGDYSKINYLVQEESFSQIGETLKALKRDRAEVLKGVSLCLEACDKLLNKIGSFNSTVDSRELVLQRDVEMGTRQVHRWLERLHDRRVILEDKLRNKREQFEEFLQYSKYDKEIKDLEDDLSKLQNFSQEFDFGEDLTSCDRRKEELIETIHQLKVLQERALLTAKRLDEAECQRAKFYQRSGLKTKIYEILGRTNDLLTSSIDLDLSFVEAKDFFQLADLVRGKLETVSESNTPVITKSELNGLTYDALSKGEILLDSYGWDSNKTKGVRVVHDSLLKKKNDLLEEIEHLEVLDEYNHFLECVNQAYQNILNIETSTLRQGETVPVDLELLKRFKSCQEARLEDVTRKLNLKELMQKLDQIYPAISEDEKLSTEEKINELKSLSNLIVELLIQRISVADEWMKILEMYENGGGRGLEVSSPADRKRVQDLLHQITSLYSQIQEQLQEVHRSDPDLITKEMEDGIEGIIKSLEAKLKLSVANDKVRQICHKYKVKLDHHLFGESGPSSGGAFLPTSQYYPVLTEADVAEFLDQKKELQSLCTFLADGIKVQLERKLEETLRTFFQPLVTSFRQEISDVEVDLGIGDRKKSQEEEDVEKYSDRLKESYVTVTKEIQTYVGHLIQFCKEVQENTLGKRLPETVEEIQTVLHTFEVYRTEEIRRGQKDLDLHLQHLLNIVQQEEPPIEAAKEARLIGKMTSKLTDGPVEEEMQKQFERMSKALTEKLIQADLNQINRQLNDLISDLDRPSDYGDNLSDAKENLANFQRFEKTVELLEDKLKGMLSLAGIPETDDKAKALRDRLADLNQKRQRRKELILLSLEYFRLIDLSKAHYEKVKTELEGIRDESKKAEISIPAIEELLRQLGEIKDKEGEEEERLAEIHRISDIIFAGVATGRDHGALRVQKSEMTGELERVQSDLTELLGLFRSRAESLLKSEGPPPPRVDEEVVGAVPPPVLVIVERVVEEESHQMWSQTLSGGGQRGSGGSPRASPIPPPHRLEKETQFESEETPAPPAKLERDTVTQTSLIRTSPLLQSNSGVQTGGTDTAESETQTENYSGNFGDLGGSYPEEMEVIMEEEVVDPAFIQSLKDLVVKEGEHVVLECRTTGAVKRLEWLKDGMDISSNTDYRTEVTEEAVAKLSIQEVLKEDSAIFTCRAYGGPQGSVVVETSGKLTVKEPMVTILKPPTFLPHSSASTGVHGKPHKIQLRVEGNPLPTVQWFKGGDCIDTSPDYFIAFNNGLCEIEFDELRTEIHGGTYRCLAVNQIGEADISVDLHVIDDGRSKKLSRQRPRITRPLPKNVMVRAGQTLKLELEFESPSKCAVVWTKDGGKPLTKVNSGAEVKMIDNVATVTFQEAYPVNGGTYTAVIEYEGGAVTSSCQVIVKGILPVETSDDSELNISDMEAVKPVVKMDLKDIQTFEGDMIRLDCVIVAHPEPEVIWYKNKSLLKESPNLHLQYRGDRCSLIIEKSSLNDGGTYAITAINSGGAATSICDVRVLVHDAPVEEKKPVAAPKFSRLLEDKMVTAGDTVDFIVELSPQYEDEELSVTWWKNNTKVVPSDMIDVCKSRSLFILRLKECTVNDRGNYMAKASNSGGETKCFASLIVKENLELHRKAVENPKIKGSVPLVEQPRKLPATRLTNKAPRFVIPLESRMVDEGDVNVSMSCDVDANPPAFLEWSKGHSKPFLTSEEANVDPMYLYGERAGYAELTIRKVAISDQGRYTCLATNIHGVSSSVADLIVKKKTFPPVLNKKLDNSITLEEGRRLFLEIDVYGTPAPEIKWVLNGSVLDAPEIELKSDTPTRHSLSIPSIRGRHGGIYTVTASNEVGEVASTCKVVIVGQPESPLKEISEMKVKATAPVPNPKPVAAHTNEASCGQSQGNNMSMFERRHEEVSRLEGQTLVQTTSTRQEHSSFETTSSSTTTTTGGLSTPMLETRISKATEPPYSSNRYAQMPVLTPISPIRPHTPYAEMPTIEMSAMELEPKMPTLELAVIEPTMPVLHPYYYETSTPDLFLEPGPEPEILIAPAPAAWNKHKNQVLEKVKTFQHRSEIPDLSSPPIGGVRIIPQKEFLKQQKIPTVAVRIEPEELVNFSTLPVNPVSSTEISQVPSTSGNFQYPNIIHDSTSSTERSEYRFDNRCVQTESTQHSQTSSSEFTVMKPSKFVPEKMRESDYESEFESNGIPSKWHPVEVAGRTSSAFVSTQAPSVPLTSMGSNLEGDVSNHLKEGRQKPIVPLKPRALAVTTTSTDATKGVQRLVNSWPPIESETEDSHHSATSTTFTSLESRSDKRYLSAPQTQSTSRLSPVSVQIQDRSRSPTPSREGLEMDRLFSRPMRFVPTSKLATSPAPSPLPVSPRSFHDSGVVAIKPKVPAKPQHSQARASQFSAPPSTTLNSLDHYPTSPVQTTGPPHSKPVVAPKPSNMNPKLPSVAKYYVSSVSTPRTTPVPMSFSPPPGYCKMTPCSPMEEVASSSLNEYTTASLENRSTFFNRSGAGDSLFSLLDKSYLPPPGEPPKFYYSPPPPSSQTLPKFSIRAQSQQIPVQTSQRSMSIPDPPGISTSSSSMTTSSSFSSMTKVVTVTTGEGDGSTVKQTSTTATTPGPKVSNDFGSLQTRKSGGHIQPKLQISGKPAVSSRPKSMEIVPYLKPTKFTPKLDYASSLEKGYSSDQDSGPIRPKWNPTGDERVTLTTWKRVQYEPPVNSKPRRNSLTLYVDKRMQDLNQTFKDNIGQMSQGLCYNKLDRNIQSDLGTGDTGGRRESEETDMKESVDAKPLIYFKYDFGYEFGIADPRVVIRSSSEPPHDRIPDLPLTSGKAGEDDKDGTIHLPIIHEKSKK